MPKQQKPPKKTVADVKNSVSDADRFTGFILVTWAGNDEKRLNGKYVTNVSETECREQLQALLEDWSSKSAGETE